MGLLRLRDFLLLFLSRNISRLGDSFTSGALIVFAAITSHNSPVAVSLVWAATYAPRSFFSFVAGVYAERWDKRTAMIAADLLRMVLVAGLYFAPNLVVLVVLAFCVNMVRPLYTTAYQALLPNVVGRGDELMQANSLNQSAGSVADVVGFAFGGAAIALVGVRPPFLFDALTYLVSAILLGGVVQRLAGDATAKAKASFLHDLTHGAATVFRSALSRSLILQMVAVSLPLGVFNAIVILLLPQAYHASAKLFPYFEAVQGAGMAFLGVALAKWPRAVGRRHLVNLGFAVTGMAVVGMALVPTVSWGMVMYFALGLGNVAFSAALVTWYRQSLPDEIRARGMSIYSSLINLPIFLGAVLSGPIVLAAGLVPTVAVAGVLFVAVGGAGYFIRATREGEVASAAAS